MAHYVAESIEAVKTAHPKDQASKKKRCFDAILALWKYRADLPEARRPFRNIESILSALESLDLKTENSRYYRVRLDELQESAGDGEIKQLLEAVKGIDYSARLLVRFFLSQAAAASGDRSAEWAALAEDTGVPQEFDSIALRLFTREQKLLEPVTEDDLRRKELSDRTQRLRAFAKTAEAIANDYEKAMLGAAQLPSRSSKAKKRARKSVSK